MEALIKRLLYLVPIVFFLGCSNTPSILPPFVKKLIQTKPSETKATASKTKKQAGKKSRLARVNIHKKRLNTHKPIAIEKISQEIYPLSTIEAMTVCWRNEKNIMICDGPLPEYTDLRPVSPNWYFKGVYKGGKHCTPRKGPLNVADKQVYYCDFPLNPDNRLGYPVIEDTIKKYKLRLPEPRKRYRCKDDAEFVGNCVETGSTY